MPVPGPAWVFSAFTKGENGLQPGEGTGEFRTLLHREVEKCCALARHFICLSISAADAPDICHKEFTLTTENSDILMIPGRAGAA